MLHFTPSVPAAAGDRRPSRPDQEANNADIAAIGRKDGPAAGPAFSLRPLEYDLRGLEADLAAALAQVQWCLRTCTLASRTPAGRARRSGSAVAA